MLQAKTHWQIDLPIATKMDLSSLGQQKESGYETTEVVRSPADRETQPK
jgi:hypothetical protein